MVICVSFSTFAPLPLPVPLLMPPFDLCALVVWFPSPFRKVRPDGDARISWIEAYLDGNPGTVIVDAIDRVANCINRVTTLEVCSPFSEGEKLTVPLEFLLLLTYVYCSHLLHGTCRSLPRSRRSKEMCWFV